MKAIPGQKMFLYISFTSVKRKCIPRIVSLPMHIPKNFVEKLFLVAINKFFPEVLKVGKTFALLRSESQKKIQNCVFMILAIIDFFLSKSVHKRIC